VVLGFGFFLFSVKSDALNPQTKSN